MSHRVCRATLKPVGSVVMLAVVALTLLPAPAPGDTGVRASWRPDLLVTVGSWSPFGSILKQEFGSRYPIGIEARVRAASGLGGAVGAEFWWRQADQRLSGMLPVTLEFNYAYPLLDGAVVPFGGLCARYAHTWISWKVGEDAYSETGAGFGLGPVLGTEAPLGSRFRGMLRFRLVLGESRLSYSAARGGLEPGEHRVGMSSFDITLGVTSDLLDACLW